MKVIPLEGPVKRTCIRIDQEFVWIKSMPVLRIVWAVDPVAIKKPWLRIRQMTVQDVVGASGQLHAGNLMRTVFVEQTKLNSFRICRE